MERFHATKCCATTGHRIDFLRGGQALFRLIFSVAYAQILSLHLNSARAALGARQLGQLTSRQWRAERGAGPDQSGEENRLKPFFSASKRNESLRRLSKKGGDD